MKKVKRAKCFIFHEDFAEYIEQMSDEECKQYILALVAYHQKGKMTQFNDRFLQTAFNRSVALISESEDKYKAKCERMEKINERKKLRQKAKDNNEQPTEEPKKKSQLKPQPVPEPQPIEPTPEPIPTPSPEPLSSYEAIFQQTPDEDEPQQTTLSYTTAKVGDILVMNGKRVVKRTNGVFVIPTLDEVTDYINEKGYHFQASTFLEYYENSKPLPWHMANGNPVKAWKQCCTTFEQHIYLSEGKRAMARQQSPPVSHAHDNINEKVYEPY